ncbi:hypothetical protein LOK49_LG06G02830 [Camellia lanceoleosa]|uniref:Uncharacterized protein n=1 Tax=Camellia lanceoleosa TaxID=1840588 RepID=A0ACC0HAY2_9ERIC|nr:hypothetical protein LOK49_LG06G02830 [Camellia lanceoleosa]
MAEDDQLRDTSMVAESDLQKGLSEEIGYVCQTRSARLLVSPKMRAVDDGEVGIQNSGFIKTLSGPNNMDRGLNLFVDLKSTHECYGSHVAPVVVPHEAQSADPVWSAYSSGMSMSSDLYKFVVATTGDLLAVSG